MSEQLEINKIYNMDCLDGMRLIEDCSIDAIVTDPPYLKKYLYTYDYLADLCPRVMKQGSSLVTICGHYALPDIIDKFRNKLKYRWMFCMSQFDGSHARMAMGVEVTWKPCLWYVKGSYPQGRGFIRDGFCVNGQKKTYHKWEQDLVWAEYFISKLSKEGDLILDPFMGSGTIAIACMNTNRNYIGFEIDKESYDISIERIKRHKEQL